MQQTWTGEQSMFMLGLEKLSSEQWLRLAKKFNSIITQRKVLFGCRGKKLLQDIKIVHEKTILSSFCSLEICITAS